MVIELSLVSLINFLQIHTLLLYLTRFNLKIFAQNFQDESQVFHSTFLSPYVPKIFWILNMTSHQIFVLGCPGVHKRTPNFLRVTNWCSGCLIPTLQSKTTLEQRLFCIEKCVFQEALQCCTINDKYDPVETTTTTWLPIDLMYKSQHLL